MRVPTTLLLIFGLMLSASADSGQLAGEWSNEPGNCDELRIVYGEDGRHPTEIQADGEWVIVNESLWKRDGEVVEVTTDGQTETWQIDHLDDERAVLINQDDQARELGAGEVELFRCPPRED